MIGSSSVISISIIVISLPASTPSRTSSGCIKIRRPIAIILITRSRSLGVPRSLRWMRSTKLICPMSISICRRAVSFVTLKLWWISTGSTTVIVSVVVFVGRTLSLRRQLFRSTDVLLLVSPHFLFHSLLLAFVFSGHSFLDLFLFLFQ